MPTLHDVTRDHIEDTLTWQMINGASLTARCLVERSLRTIPRPKAEHSGYIDPVSMTPYLIEAQSAVQTDLVKEAHGYSSLRWLWYLRRLPRAVFEDDYLVSTFLYDSTLAEAVSACSTNMSFERIPFIGITAFPVNERAIERVLVFCFGVKYLSAIHVLLRRAGKGAQFTFGRSTLPRGHFSPEQAKSVELYDARGVGQSIYLSRLGTVVAADRVSSLQPKHSIMLLTYAEEPKFAPVPWAPGPRAETHYATSYVDFVPSIISIDGLRSLIRDSTLASTSWLPKETGALLLLLSLPYAFGVSSDNFFTNICRVGYHMIQMDALQDLFASFATTLIDSLSDLIPSTILPKSAEELVDTLSTDRRGSLWPLLPGSSIRRAGGLDFYAASIQLDSCLAYPSDNGNVANIRAQHFELYVQSRINESLWRPPDDILALRGRTLFIDGQALIDVDVIGAQGDTLLIVSCKSTIRTGKYDVGNYEVVRNTATMAVKAVGTMLAIKQRLADTLKCDNYNFSAFRRIISPVCTPSEMFVPIGEATEMVAPGLMAACSWPELEHWLNVSQE